MNKNLKLAVHDNDDLTILSSLLQDATLLVGDMGYDAEAPTIPIRSGARFLTLWRNGQKRRRLMGGALRRHHRRAPAMALICAGAPMCYPCSASHFRVCQ